MRRSTKTAIALLLLAFLAPLSETRAESRKPNLVLIFIDDMGWKDTTYGGSDLYETPNIDRLRREGMMFTNAYAAAGNCAPSRVRVARPPVAFLSWP